MIFQGANPIFNVGSLSYGIVNSLENVEEEYLSVSGYRKLKNFICKKNMRTVQKFYMFIAKNILIFNEDGQNASVREQHRGCLWIERHQHILPALVNMRK